MSVKTDRVIKFFSSANPGEPIATFNFPQDPDVLAAVLNDMAKQGILARVNRVLAT